MMFTALGKLAVWRLNGLSPSTRSTETSGRKDSVDMRTSLRSKLDRVHDEDTFVAFVYALADDRIDEVRKEKEKPSSPYGPGANGWENGTIEAYLESAAAWARDWKKSVQYHPPANPWKRCAEILYAGKIYE